MTSPLPSQAITAPHSDLWLTGGLSVVVLVVLGMCGLLGSSELVLQEFLVLTVLLNGTHFMASYRLLYSSREFACSYPSAAFYVPGFLLVCAAFGIGVSVYNPEWSFPLKLLTVTATLYLALHYTGQAWGMVCSFAFLEGIRFSVIERRVLRLCLRFMAIWHLVWGIKLLWPSLMEHGLSSWHIDAVLNTLGCISLMVGLLCFRSVASRIGRQVPARVLVPYVALHVWYAFLYVFPKSIFWVQLFHALQYLPFPMRVELNRSSEGHSTSARYLHVVLYFLTLAALSAIVFGVVPWFSKGMVGGANCVWVAIAAVINIHHYYIDGCIWHINNPRVRDDLFAHVRQEVRSDKSV